MTESVSAADLTNTRGTGGDLIIMGPPGVGKGTQAKALAQENGWVQLSTGEVFRDHIRRGTDLGRRVKDYLARGEYVPDDVTIRMVRAKLEDISPSTRVLFDGFPRTVEQAKALDRLFEEIAYIAYHFHWPLEEILDLEHPLRRRFVEEIGRINQRLAEEA